MITTTPGIAFNLQAKVQSYLNRWIAPCYTTPYEHITGQANEYGEVYLTGLVNDHQLVSEAMQMLQSLPGVSSITDEVTVLYQGAPLKL